MFDLMQKHMVLAVWLQAAAAWVGVGYVIHLLREAVARQQGRSAAQLVMARNAICALRDLAQSISNGTNSDGEVNPADGWTGEDAAILVEEVMYLRPSKMPSLVAAETVDDAMDTALKLEAWLREDASTGPDIKVRIIEIYRQLACSSATLQAEGARLRGRHFKPPLVSRVLALGWMRGAEGVGLGTAGAVVRLKSLADTNRGL